MGILKVDTENIIGKIRNLYSVNNGPFITRGDQSRGNEKAYAALNIPYARNHDASFNSCYGGEHSVDVQNIFRDFDADVNDENSYDFVLTDQYVKETLSCGTKTFYRLGTKIEHEIKKYGTLPPKDFKKWAQICEHIIRHYTEGWAKGFEFDMPYWEIWNEPDMCSDDASYVSKKTWGGTKQEFFEFYSITAKHLKACFPNLKIGGPAVCYGPGNWTKSFIEYIKESETPLDFFSWHTYLNNPDDVVELANKTREILNEYGFFETESVLNEWNYVKNWTTEFVDSIKAIINEKGAAFTGKFILNLQNKTDVDMAMYYDARPCVFNGLFDFYTMEKLKGYYPFLFFSKLYELGSQVKAECNEDDISVVAASNGEKFAIMISNFNDDNPKQLVLNLEGIPDGCVAYIVDKYETMKKINVSGSITVTPYANIFITNSTFDNLE